MHIEKEIEGFERVSLFLFRVLFPHVLGVAEELFLEGIEGELHGVFADLFRREVFVVALELMNSLDDTDGVLFIEKEARDPFLHGLKRSPFLEGNDGTT